MLPHHSLFIPLVNKQWVWVDQMYRTISGDKMYHNHSYPIEDVDLAVLSALINRTAGVTDLPLSVFEAPDISVCTGICSIVGADVSLSDRYATVQYRTLQYSSVREYVCFCVCGCVRDSMFWC